LKKNLLYILIGTISIVVALLLFGIKQEKQIDKRVTLDKRYKIPYGTYVTFNLLPTLFPLTSEIATNKDAPTDWFDTDNTEKSGTLFFLITQHFDPSEEEILLLNRFVSQGNHVFICSPKFDQVALDFFGMDMSYGSFSGYSNFSDSPQVQLNKPWFENNSTYTYPGFSFSVDFLNFKRNKFHVIGTDKNGIANFMKADVGKGSFYLHSDPLLFSNYFILYKNNKDYFEKSMSLIPNSIKNIVWDEYFVYKQENNENGNSNGKNNSSKKVPSSLRLLLSVPGFQWAFWLAVLFLLLYLLLNMKRNQRIVPVISKPKNESLDFVKIIGRLYFEKKDHLNLAQKMVTYFLEHVRTRYFINTSALNDEFVRKLSGKSGYEELEVKKLLETIFTIQTSSQISQQQLINYYQQFQKFYKYIG